MKTPILYAAIAAVVVAIPAALGLWGNASFAQSVPVTVPDDARIVGATPTPTPTPSATPTPTPTPGVDDNGGDVPRDERIEPGDDRDVNGGAPSDDSPSVSGSDDSGSHSGSDDSGSHSGSDDSGSGSSGDDGGHHGGDDSDHRGDDSGHGSDD